MTQAFEHPLSAAAAAPIDGTSGNDLLLGTADSEILRGFDGNDTLLANGGNDQLEGGAGNDFLDGVSGDDRLDGGSGNDTLHGGIGNDIYVFGTGYGQDTISESGSNSETDRIELAAGVTTDDIVLTRSGDNLILSINGTSDQLTVSNHFKGALTNLSNAIDGIQFADGTVWDQAYILTHLEINDGANFLYGTSGNDVLDGLGGDDEIFAEAGDDIVFGSGGNDVLHGGAGNDTLNGGSGNDTYYGDAGDDTYVFGLGSGQDKIYGFESDTYDQLHVGADIGPDDVTLSRHEGDLILSVNGTDDQITVVNFFYMISVGGIGDDGEFFKIKFADGTIWGKTYINANLGATAGDDWLDGTAGDDVLSGLEGDDRLTGKEGNDTLDGGAGNDRLEGDGGSDTYLFGIGSGQDTIYNAGGFSDVDRLVLGAGITTSDVILTRVNSSDLLLSIKGTSDSVLIMSQLPDSFSAIDRIEFADGTVWTAADIQANLSATNGNDILNGTSGDNVLNGLGGDDQIYGNDGNDILDGGSGDDFLVGGKGDDTYLFGLGSGHDVVQSADGGVDQIVLGSGVQVRDVVLTRVDDDLLLSIKGSSDKLSVAKFFDDKLDNLDSMTFADGTLWSRDDILAHVTITNRDDTIYGTSGNDVLSGLGGDDQIIGLGGNDTLNGDAGDDFIVAGRGRDVLHGGDDVDMLLGQAGDDTVIGDAGNDALYGGEGNDKLDGGLGNDVLIGDEGNDVLAGGAGNDSLNGGYGDDTYLFGLGSGKDVINSVGGGADWISLGAGVSSDGVTLVRHGDSLNLLVTGTTDKLEIKYYFQFSTPNIAGIKFADGTVLDAAAISDMFLTGTAGNDDIVGTGGADVLYGLGGDDSLSGKLGDDVLIGGEGSDTLNGASGADTFVFDAALGSSNVDVILHYESADTIQLDNAFFAQLSPAVELNADFFAANLSGEAGDANDYILYETDTGKLFYDADGNGAGAKVQFAVLGTNSHPALTAADFAVI